MKSKKTRATTSPSCQFATAALSLMICFAGSFLVPAPAGASTQDKSPSGLMTGLMTSSLRAFAAASTPEALPVEIPDFKGVRRPLHGPRKGFLVKRVTLTYETGIEVEIRCRLCQEREPLNRGVHSLRAMYNKFIPNEATLIITVTAKGHIGRYIERLHAGSGHVVMNLRCLAPGTRTKPYDCEEPPQPETPVSPTNRSPPDLSGSPVVGESLSCSSGTWAAKPVPVYSYHWQREHEAIAGAESAFYEVQAADEGRQLSCFVTATNEVGSSSAASAAATVAVAPVNTAPPQVTGVAREGETLECSVGEWSGTRPLQLTRQWLRDEVSITGEIGPTYRIGPEDEAHLLSCEVTARNLAGSTVAKTLTKAVVTAPSNEVLPQVTGIPKAGETLECSPGTWTGTPPLSFSREWLLDGVSIPGEIQSTYQVQPADEGHLISCQVLASNDVGSSSARAVAKVIESLPVNDVPPQILGIPVIGELLECTNGSWSGTTPITYHAEWRRDNVTIAGQTLATYKVTDADEGHVLSCLVTASNPIGSRNAESKPELVTSFPVNRVPPEIEGIAKAGGALICNRGTWAGAAPITYDFQWSRDSRQIPGATSNTHQLVAEDEGHSILCEVKAINAAGSAIAVSTAVTVPSLAASKTLPTISGGVRVGEQLTCSEGSWSGTEPMYFTYQWRRDTTGMPGETSRTHNIAAADEGHKLSCEVTAHNAAGTANATSNATVIPVPPSNTSKPVTTGGHLAGQKLVCSDGSWSGTVPITLTFQWLRDGIPIPASGSAEYTLQTEDEGHDIACSVIAENDGGSTAAVSAAVAIPDEVKRQKESELITSINDGGSDFAPFEGPAQRVAIPFTAESDELTYAGVVIGNPNLARGPSGETITLEICETPACVVTGEIGVGPARVDNYGLTTTTFDGEDLEVLPGHKYYLVWVMPPDIKGAEWLAFWHDGGPTIEGATDIEGVVRGYNFVEGGPPRKVWSYYEEWPGPHPYSGTFTRAIQAFVAKSNEITALGVALANPALPRWEQGPAEVTLKLCRAANCEGGPLSSTHGKVFNYEQTWIELPAAVPVTIGKTYYLSWVPPEPQDGTAWQTFWTEGASNPEEAAGFQISAGGFDEGSTKYEPSYETEHALDSTVPTFKASTFWIETAEEGPTIAPSQVVEVSCRIFDPFIEAAEPEGFLYRVHTWPWDDEYIAPADMFANGARPGETIETDYAVPECSD